MKCPLKKIINYIRDENQHIVERRDRFDECNKHDCMAYKKYSDTCVCLENKQQQGD